MSEQTAELVAGVPGAENAIRWPTPMLPGVLVLTFRGHGDGRTESFVLPGDASVRIVAERGPFVLRVVRPDGSDAVKPADMSYGGFGLGSITEGGAYAFEARAVGAWGITVLFAGAK
jgi:hypothetical protein